MLSFRGVSPSMACTPSRGLIVVHTPTVVHTTSRGLHHPRHTLFWYTLLLLWHTLLWHTLLWHTLLWHTLLWHTLRIL